MKAYHWIIAIVLLLAANNYALLEIVGYFDDDQMDTLKPNLSAPSVNKEQPRAITQSQAVDRDLEIEQGSTGAVVSEEQPDLTEAFAKFTQSEDFLAVMDRYSMTAGKRMMERMERFAGMSAQELYQTFSASDDPTEKQMALQGLTQGKLNDLSITELKDVYVSSENEFFGKYQALQELLEKDDPEAIEWAKESLNDPLLAMTGGYEIVSALYDKDPEYVKAHVEDMTISDLNNSQFSASMLLQQNELQEVFYKNNLDEILASDNTQLFQMSPYNLELEMNRDQQVSLTELYSSNNRHKRHFAIYLTRNIEDPQLLREAYSNLKNKQDRQTMLSIMNSNKDQKDIAKELAAESNQ